ncbi:Short-chain dehydrogenase, associated with 2-hydroxychromene-2-carboxylate isomerase family protein [Minicystis rosea]|nr:Short-chain dehydrogenase, associated with 2-hydroxychromene-2-carboxylate isomerase family protein [Minicystis rosea]
MSTTNVAAVLGVGPGLGAAVARRFAREGFAVALMARRADALRSIEEQITGAGGKAISVAVDAADAGSVALAFADVRARLGDPEVFVHNASAFIRGNVLDLKPEQIEQSWRVSCLGAFLAAREVAPSMIQKGRGTLLFTGASAALRGSAGFASFAIGKFGLRALCQSLARELHPQGVHVAHVIIDGQIDTPAIRAMMPGRATETLLDPEAIAETYFQLHRQPPTAWTHELDLRPSVEKF